MKKKNKESVETSFCKPRQGGFFGVLLVIIGIVFLLKSFGLFTVVSLSWVATLWPLGLIFAGVAFLFKQRLVGYGFLILTVGFCILYLTSSVNTDEQRVFDQEIALDSDITHAHVKLDYDAGDINIAPGSSDVLFFNTVSTSGLSNPEMKYSSDGDVANLYVSRNSPQNYWKPYQEDWDVSLSPNVIYNLEANFGAANMNMDLRSLMVDSLNIECGATDVSLIFASYPTTVFLKTGASDVSMEFPSDMNVVISVDGGAMSTDFDGFEKRNGKWYNDRFDDTSPNIISINIDAGASSISGDFYAVVAQVPEKSVPAIELEIIRNDTNNS